MRAVLGIAFFVFSAWFIGRSLPDSLGGSVDFVEYAAAARLLNEGKNPYDGELLLTFQQEVGWKDSKAQMMWNPPWVFPLVLPLAYVPVASGFLAWNALQVSLVVLSCVWCWQRRDRIGVPILLGILFAPTIFLLRLGQSSGFLLFGLAAFPVALRHRRPVLAGLAAALTAFKPHLFFPFAVLFVAEAFRESVTRRALITGGIAMAAAAAFPLIFNPDVWQQFTAALRAPGDEFHYSPADWKPPIFSAKLAQWTGGGPAVQFAPSIVGTLALFAYWLRKKEWNWSNEMPMVVVVCLLTTGYGAWGFDLVVLLIPIVDAARRLMEQDNPRFQLWSAAAFMVLNAAMFAGTIPVVWWVPLIALGYMIVRTLTRPRNCPAGQKTPV